MKPLAFIFTCEKYMNLFIFLTQTLFTYHLISLQIGDYNYEQGKCIEWVLWLMCVPQVTAVTGLHWMDIAANVCF